jgi:hypothetical protein
MADTQRDGLVQLAKAGWGMPSGADRGWFLRVREVRDRVEVGQRPLQEVRGQVVARGEDDLDELPELVRRPIRQIQRARPPAAGIWYNSLVHSC